MGRGKVGKVAQGRVMKGYECHNRIMDLTLWWLGIRWRLRCSDVMWLREYFRKTGLPIIVGWIKERENRGRETNWEATRVVQVWGAKRPRKENNYHHQRPPSSWRNKERWPEEETSSQVGERPGSWEEKEFETKRKQFWHVPFVVTAKYLGKRSNGQSKIWAQGSVEKTRSFLFAKNQIFPVLKVGRGFTNMSLVTRLGLIIFFLLPGPGKDHGT